jgi:PAS domain S-box-containing protein
MKRKPPTKKKSETPPGEISPDKPSGQILSDQPATDGRTVALSQKGGITLFKTLFEEVALPLMVTDENGGIIFANRGVAQASGYTVAELSASTLRDLCAPYERGRFLFVHLSQIKETTEIDVDFQKKNGKFFMAHLSFSPFHHQGRFLLFLVLRDVTQRRVQEGKKREDEDRYRKLLEEKNRLEEQLQRSRKLAALGELSAGVAHEINNPLAVISEEAGWLQDLLKRPEGSDLPEMADFRDSLREIVQQAQRCKEVTHNLLRLGRPLETTVQEVEIRRLLEEVIGQKVRETEGRPIKFIGEFDSELPSIPSDWILLRQVLLNFLNNAVDALSAEGRITVKATLVPAQRVEVAITDTGCGISPENLPKIFDPFFTTKSPGKGTGLGLSLSHTILEKLGGSVSVRSRLGQGTTFTIQLPLGEKGVSGNAAPDSNS